MTDEFEIHAIGHPSEPNRKWTRSNLKASESIANQAVDELGYQRSWVINTYGGHVSDPLYERNLHDKEDNFIDAYLSLRKEAKAESKQITMSAAKLAVKLFSEKAK